MSEAYCVRVAGAWIGFSAAHFITFGPGECEQLHGHNYRVAAEVAGPLDEHACVVDFVALETALRGILDAFDHRVLLPTAHPQIRVKALGEEVEARFAQRRWVFPRGDCVLLPVTNTTAELMARYIGRRLLESLAGIGCPRPQQVRIELSEGRGRSATWQWRPRSEDGEGV
jgi:6-pyruvoyltetrahydropterin/6-carboxytetrahydropterin synthase